MLLFQILTGVSVTFSGISSKEVQPILFSSSLNVLPPPLPMLVCLVDNLADSLQHLKVFPF